MITIKHHGMAASGFARASVKTDSLAEYDETNASYALGYRPPNYPVPATLKNAGVATTHEDAAICLKSLGMVAFLMVYDDARLD